MQEPRPAISLDDICIRQPTLGRPVADCLLLAWSLLVIAFVSLPLPVLCNRTFCSTKQHGYVSSDGTSADNASADAGAKA